MTSDISSSQSYQPADPREPVLDISIGDLSKIFVVVSCLCESNGHDDA